jgi:hypothetical protein
MGMTAPTPCRDLGQVEAFRAELPRSRLASEVAAAIVERCRDTPATPR